MILFFSRKAWMKLRKSGISYEGHNLETPVVFFLKGRQIFCLVVSSNNYSLWSF